MNDRQTILLVDDSEDDLVLLRGAFKKAGFDNPLQQVENGEKGIAYLKGEGPDSDRNKFPLPTVMSLDLNMPMRNGFDVLACLRTQPGLKRLTVVILTASTRQEDLRLLTFGAGALLQANRTLDSQTAALFPDGFSTCSQ